MWHSCYMSAAGEPVGEKGGSMEKEKTECVMSSVIRIETWRERVIGKPEIVRYKIRKVYSNDKLVYEDKMTNRIYLSREDVFRQLDRFLLGLKESESRQDSHCDRRNLFSFFKVLWLKLFG